MAQHALISRDDIIAKVIASSVFGNHRIDTLQVRYPRIIHAELMTHRVFSRNASSSRAIPTNSILIRDQDMFVPNFRHNQSGMQPGAYLSASAQAKADEIWRRMAVACIEGCKELAEKDGLNIHKQYSNRPLEWFGYIDVLITSTYWANFDHLRIHSAAQEELQLLARVMKETRDAATPRILKPGEWHLPYVSDEERANAEEIAPAHRNELQKLFESMHPIAPDFNPSYGDLLLLMASAARCCRLSYSKLDGTPTTFEEDFRRFTQLVPSDSPVHASPLEHQAMGLTSPWQEPFQGNLRGFAQFRKLIPQEAVMEG